MSSSTTRFLMLLTAAPSPLLRRCLSPFFHNRRRLLSLSPSPLRLASPRQLHSPAAAVSSSTPSFPSPPEHHYHHPWPEWSSLLGYLSSAGHFDASGVRVSVPGLPEDAASACLSFARLRPDILGMLPRRDIEVVVEKGEPFLFDDRAESVRRMMLFLTNNVLDGNDRAETAVDLMKYLLSYVSSAAASTGRSSGHLVELSVRNLLQKMSQLGDQYYRGVHTNGQEGNQLGSAQNQVLDGYLHTTRPLGQNPELRRGDWICHRCRFMNFNRNVKCLQCKEAQPKRQLTGGEWECPQCDFYNYGRNTVCLRCDCKQPAVASLGTRNVGSGLVYHDDLNNMSRADNASDVSEATANEDFPEIMPLRKGVNRFVVSSRKSPLERRLVDGQRQRNQNNWGTSKSYGLQNIDGEKAVGGTISQKLDDTFGTKRFGSDNMTSRGQNAGTKYLSGDFRANDFDNVEIDKQKSNSLDAGGHTGAIYQDSALGSSPENRRPMEEPRGHNRMNMEKEQAGKSDQWFDRVAELHNVTDASSGISDGDFPDIMPMPEGENRFVVSRKKDRSLTSPTYKRRMAMDPANTTNHVPFVPFPPNYFAQKDNQQPGGKTIRQSSNSASAENVNRTSASPMANVPGSKNQESSTENQNFGASGRYSNAVTTNSSYEKPISRREAQNAENCAPSASGSWRRKHSVPGYMGGRLHSTGESSQNISTPQENGLDPGSSGYSLPKYSSNTTTSAGKTSPLPEDANFTSWSTGKSLEGSQVKEPDPLDMSEEAKAERWFRRVAQIKDISELSQIPDEDFPSIMPMRKGVNRFVVSKRKTPLERRLASNQYRRNLPTVSTDPENENNSS